ncbi:hypothetical protein JHK82_043330 [Glycine max]|nr:hypothetical protein JHK82_043330 [Glycine max]
MEFCCSESTSNSRVLCHNPGTITPNLSQAEAAWLQSFYTEKDQNKHAIPVAAATAAADAAMAAAQAAVAVVRLTSQGRVAPCLGLDLRCGLPSRFKQCLEDTWLMTTKNEAYRSQIRARRSMERFDDTKSEYAVPIHSRRVSSYFDATINNNSVDGIPKIVEVDTFTPKSRNRRTVSDFGDEPSLQALSNRTPTRLSIPDQRNFQDSEWGLTGEEQYGNFPNYMASTQSFKAKLRSHSAPKQRPEPGPRKRISLNEMMESRSSLSGVRMQRSCSQVQEVISFKNAVMGKLQKST